MMQATNGTVQRLTTMVCAGGKGTYEYEHYPAGFYSTREDPGAGLPPTVPHINGGALPLSGVGRSDLIYADVRNSDVMTRHQVCCRRVRLPRKLEAVRPKHALRPRVYPGSGLFCRRLETARAATSTITSTTAAGTNDASLIKHMYDLAAALYAVSVCAQESPQDGTTVAILGGPGAFHMK